MTGFRGLDVDVCDRREIHRDTRLGQAQSDGCVRLLGRTGVIEEAERGGARDCAAAQRVQTRDVAALLVDGEDQRSSCRGSSAAR